MDKNTTSLETKQKWVSVSHVATVLGLHRNTVYAMIRDGELPSRRFGNAIRIPVAALDAINAITFEPAAASPTPQ